MFRRARPETLLLIVGIAAFGTMLFKHLSYPLLWQDEAETVMFGTRILEYGYPKVHGERNVVYEFGPNIALGVSERFDAYIGKTWGDFYFAVPGIVWAAGVGDLYAKTWRLRLPFAAAGALGMAVLALAVTPVFRGDRRRAQLFAALFFLLAAVSISLVLHLREVRYYALLLLLAAGIFHVHLRYTVFGTLGFRGYAIALTLLLFLLFNVFHAAYFEFAALLGLDGLAAARRADGDRLRRGLASLAPLAASAVLLAPLLWFFETFQIAEAFSQHLGFTLSGYASNVAAVLVHFIRHEFLVPAVACRLGVIAADAVARRRGSRAEPDAGRRVASFLGLFSAGYVAIGCANPLIYERYFVVLSPLVTAVFLLDALALMEAVPGLASPPRRRRAAAATLAGLLALTAAAGAGRIPEVRGRLEEITQRYRGPLDFAIPYLEASYAHPEDLVIATNYEAHPLMYYLGSRVIVGLSLNNIVSERQLEPDVVIPRRHWPRSLPELGRFLARGGYEPELFPVRDLHYNNIPALSRSPSLPDPHRFRTATTSDPDEQLRIYRRVEAPR